MSTNAKGTHLHVIEKSVSATGAGNSETIKSLGFGVSYYDPGGSARTGVILEAGVENGQKITVVNTADADESITFATDATSNVAGGTGVAIGQNESRTLTWFAALSRWIPEGVVNVGDIPTGSISSTKLASNAVTTAKIADANVTGAKLSTGVAYFSISKATNGTTPVNVFGSGGAPVALSITSVTVISKDTTAGNIILKNGASTVATVAKGTSAAALVGATSLANASVNAAAACTIESSSVGDAVVIITFEVV